MVAPDSEYQASGSTSSAPVAESAFPETGADPEVTIASVVDDGEVVPTSDYAATFPDESISSEWVESLKAILDWASRQDPSVLPQVVPPETAISVLDGAALLCSVEPTVFDVLPRDAETAVVVVGDTHGHFHDLCKIFSLVGGPAPDRYFVFNGDYVDRGSWGIELLLLLAAWKQALPSCVTLLRGDHECKSTTQVYGFHDELLTKYGPRDGERVYNSALALFKELPIAAVVAGSTLVVHGGLWRKRKGGRKNGSLTLRVGSLADLKAEGKSVDPEDRSIPADAMWSDPQAAHGFWLNTLRGEGITWGPLTTEQFLKDNNLKLIIRSHESPDAREYRRRRLKRNEALPQLSKGYGVDHITAAGKSLTLFSAPDYPMLLPENERTDNAAAVAILSAPGYANPRFVTFKKAPRPQEHSYFKKREEESGGADGSRSHKGKGKGCVLM